jgi:hypothetical protein
MDAGGRPNFADRREQFVEFPPGRDTAAAGDDAEAMGAKGGGFSRFRHDFPGAFQGIDQGFGLMVGRLGAKGAVFGAATRLGINNRAGLHFVPEAPFTQLLRSGEDKTEVCALRGEDGEGFLAGKCFLPQGFVEDVSVPGFHVPSFELGRDYRRFEGFVNQLGETGSQLFSNDDPKYGINFPNSY